METLGFSFLIYKMGYWEAKISMSFLGLTSECKELEGENEAGAARGYYSVPLDYPPPTNIAPSLLSLLLISFFPVRGRELWGGGKAPGLSPGCSATTHPQLTRPQR